MTQRPAGLHPALLRRLASLGYETLVVAAILLAGGLVFVGIAAAVKAVAGPAASSGFSGLERALMQGFLVLLLAAYYVRCWTRGGQTLAMKAWKLRVVGSDGGGVTTRAAIKRFALAGVALGTGAAAAVWLWRHPGSVFGWGAILPAAVDIVWAAFDREGQFLHDRLARTRVVRA